MDNNEARSLIDAFKAYRDLLTPIQTNLSEFIETYEYMRENIEHLNAAFGGDVKEKLESIYKNLSSQADKAADLSSRIDRLANVSDKYTGEVAKLMTIMGRVEDKLSTVNALEAKAEAQIGRLDGIIDEKNKNYNVKELQRSLDSYNANVAKVSEFINKGVAESMDNNRKKLESIRGGIDEIMSKQRDDGIAVEKMLETYTSVNTMLKKIAESGDVNEAYVFDLLDKWAETRKVKTRK